MKTVFSLFNKSVDQILKDYKQIQKVVLALLFFDIFDYLMQNNFLLATGSDILASLYTLTSTLFSLYLGLILLIKLNEISLDKKVVVKVRLYLKYLWANVIIFAGVLASFLVIFIAWLVFSTNKNLAGAYQNLTTVQLGLFGTIFSLSTLSWLLINTFTTAIVINEKISAKHSVLKSFRLVKNNFKTVLFFGFFILVVNIPAWIDIGGILYKSFVVKSYEREYFGTWSMFVTFYSLFIGILTSLTTLNLYKKLTKTN